ncbi:MAG: glycosyltransferase family 4 protein [Actinomycetota bacterium]|nr:MAG: hypothetical protein FD171_1466 [Actinomycetota bacterium]MDO8949065.1 glycosyltransferase family 4 protein [Actinomycetota bacterium]MDP3630592.1 glycosyltransferase family 4 protein [Actinomycetota bacterium]
MRILVLSSFTKSLLWFRLDLMDALVAAGHEVIALGSDDDEAYRREFLEHGIVYHSFRVSRNGLSPFDDLRTYRELRETIGRIAPDKVFVYQAKTIVYGGPAAHRCGAEVYPMMGGLGSIFRNSGLRNKLVRLILKVQYKNAFRRSEKVFFQNEDDRSDLLSFGLLPPEKTVMVNGSGVNLERFTQEPLPGEAVFLFVGRLLRDKGVVEYLDACAEIKRRHPQARCLLVGPYDTNPSALVPDDLEPYVADGTVEYCGEQEDVRPYITQSSVFVLPSYHEGTPKSVLEAMAMGRPIITTTAPGCRETVIDGVNGYLVEARSVQALADRMERLIDDVELVAKMGAESRRIAEERFDVHKVNGVILKAMGLGTDLASETIIPTTATERL